MATPVASRSLREKIKTKDNFNYKMKKGLLRPF